MPQPPGTLQADTVLLHQMQQDVSYAYVANPERQSYLGLAWDKFWQWVSRILHFTDDATERFFYSAGLLIFLIAVFWMWRKGHFNALFRTNRHFTLSDEEAEADIRAVDFQKETEQALHQGDYSRAARMTYLWTLQTLAAQQRIDWQPHKTVSEYTREVDSEDFRRQTRLFLLIRYGNVAADEAMYREMEALRRRVNSRETQQPNDESAT